MPTIFIDPGHGGVDGGAGYRPYLEKELVLTLSYKLRNYLLNHFNCSVVMSRTGDATLSLTERTDHANRVGADFLISVHYNAFTSTARGYEDFTWNGISSSSDSDVIRNYIHTEVVNRVLNKYGIPNRGKKKANFHMVRESNMPAVLVETLFVSSPLDQKLIANENVINAFATAYGEGIGKGLKLTRKVVTPAPAPTGSLYRVQVGAYGNRTNAVAMETRLKRAGFPAYIYTSNGLYRVQVGAFGSKTNAENMERRLRSAGFPSFIYRG